MNWIPVDERTPPQMDIVLVYCPDDTFSSYVLAFRDAKGTWFAAQSLASLHGVTHWAALTPPKGDR